MDNNEEKVEQSYGTVKVEALKKAIHQVEKHYKSIGVHPGKAEITFEFLIASFFPTIMKNIEAEMRKQYEKGFKDAKEMYENHRA